MPSDKSKRAHLREVKAGARALRRKPGWDPQKMQRTRPSDQLRDLVQSETTERSYEDAEACEACRAERLRSGDDSALCRPHFAQAMGLPLE